jgi:glycerophosphoryl diester phosphodiesterase
MLIFAHRGTNREAAENTRRAFDRALEYAVDGIETDVQLSRDEVAVLWHDRFLGKLGLPGKHVDDFDYAQLQKMNIAAHFPLSNFPPMPSPQSSPASGRGGKREKQLLIPAGERANEPLREFHANDHGKHIAPDDETCHDRFPLSNFPPQAGERANEPLREFHANAKPESMMKLEDFLDAYHKRCRLLIEIKNRDWETPLRHEIKMRQTLEMIGARTSSLRAGERNASFPGNDPIMVSSFNLASLVYAHQYAPQFPLIYNFEPEQTLDDARRVLNEQPFLRGLCLPIESLDEPIVTLLRDHNKGIAVYTCNSDEEISRALKLGVDILISDVPQLALAIRSRFLG